MKGEIIQSSNILIIGLYVIKSMENTINRKDYRRNSYDNYEKATSEKNLNQKKSSFILNQIINSLLILLLILLIKLFDFDKEFKFIEEKFYEEMPYEILIEEISEKVKNSFYSIINENYLFIESGDIDYEKIEESGENTYIDESKYITAIDGINQLASDASIIKDKYILTTPLKGIITSKFGCRISESSIVSSYHSGIDIAANTGTIINAAHDGIVTQAGENGTYGISVIIESGDLKTIYAHCSSISVKKGDIVNEKMNIGKVGMTGNATGPHLHFEVRYQERLVNPEDVI